MREGLAIPRNCDLCLLIFILNLLISYQIMLNCWKKNPVDRPTFDSLRKTVKEMERNHQVGHARIFFYEEIDNLSDNKSLILEKKY